PTLQLDFAPPEGMTSVRVVAEKLGGDGDVWLDDLQLLEVLPAEDPSLLAGWRFHDTDALVADWAARENRGAFVGAIEWMNGVVGRAPRLNGRDGAVVGDVAFLPCSGEPLTVSGWLYPDEVAHGTVLALSGS